MLELLIPLMAGLVVLLAFITVVGHGIWVLLAKLLGRGERQGYDDGMPWPRCPLCLTRLEQPARCRKCGWEALGEKQPLEPREVARQQIDGLLRQALINLVNVFIDKIIDPELYHFRLFFDEEWRPRDNEISFGHEIEGSWLLQEAAEIVGDDSLIGKTQHIAQQMVKAVLKKGIDEDGGLFYELKPDGSLETDKHWWPQAEAMVGLVNAYQLSQDPALLEQAIRVWQFTKEKIIDKEGGEWHFRVSQEGVPYTDEDKVGIWKCPYHNSRACLEILKRLG